MEEDKTSGCTVSFSLMANLPISFSQTMCVRFSGEGSSETYLAAVVFYVFLLVVWVMRVCVAIFFRRRFLKVIAFCPLPSPLPRGEGTDCRKSDNGRLQHHHSLSLWERARERVKPQI